MTIERRKDAIEFHEAVRDLKKRQLEILHDFHCLKAEIEKYKPFLDQEMEDDGNWRRLKHALIERLATGIVWGIVALVAFAIWEFVLKRVANAGEFAGWIVGWIAPLRDRFMKWLD